MTKLNPVALYLSRDRGTPTAADFAAAGMTLCEDGAVERSGRYVGPLDEFGISGQAFDKTAGKVLRGRFLVQWNEIDGEVLHHSYAQ